MADRSSCNPPVNTEPHGGQIIMHSTSQHRTTWRSDHRAFHQSTQNHMAVRSSFIPSAQNHMAVKSSYIPPVNTEPHGGQIIVHSVNTEPHGCQIIVHSTSHHSTTWRSDLVHFRSTQNHMVVRLSCIPSTQYRMVVRSRAFPVNTEPHGGQIIVHSVNTEPHGGQIIVHSTCQHSTTFSTNHRAFRQHRTTEWSHGQLVKKRRGCRGVAGANSLS